MNMLNKQSEWTGRSRLREGRMHENDLLDRLTRQGRKLREDRMNDEGLHSMDLYNSDVIF